MLPLAARADDDIIGMILEGKPIPRAPVPVAAPAIVKPVAPVATANGGIVEPRWVKLRNIHTDEKLEAVYWDKGQYVPDAVVALNKVLRDYRNDEVHPMDIRLYDILDQIQTRTGSKSHFQVISGYGRRRPTGCWPSAAAKSPSAACTWTARPWTSIWRTSRWSTSGPRPWTSGAAAWATIPRATSCTSTSSGPAVVRHLKPVRGRDERASRQSVRLDPSGLHRRCPGDVRHDPVLQRWR
jgi:hypothetical protein